MKNYLIFALLAAAGGVHAAPMQAPASYAYRVPMPNLSILEKGSLVWSTSSLNFADAPVGALSATQTVTLTNTGTTEMGITSLGIQTAGAFDIVANNCGSTLPGGYSCMVSLKANLPSADTQTDTLYATMADGSQVTVQLQATAAAPAVSLPTLSLASATLPKAVVGTAYSFDVKPLLDVAGESTFNASEVAWSVSAGALPAGLVLNADGTISGVPASGAASGSITARATYKGANGEQTYQLVVLNIEVALAPATLPQAQVGVPYSTDLKTLLSVTGDEAYAAADVTWSVVGSSLPAGLTLRTDGTIAGTPTAAGTGSITARATYRNSSGDQTYQVVSLNIAVALGAATLPQAIVGTQYSYDLKALVSVTGDSGYTAGTGLTWTLVSGTLPDGLTLGPDGTISGTPTSATTSSPVVRVSYRNVKGEQTYQLVSLNISVALAAATPPAGWVGVPYSYDLKSNVTVTGDTAYQGNATGVTWSIASGSVLPPGLTIDASTGVISGTPTVDSATGSSFTVVASYRTRTGQQVYTLVVNGVVVQATQIVSGENHVCVLTPAGGVKCWGSNNSGQIGNSSATLTWQTPQPVTGLSSGVSRIAAGGEHTCAVLTTGAVKCWGANYDGQLGNNSTSPATSPVSVVGVTGATDIAANVYHTCVVAAGAAKCWGLNASGQLGNNSTTLSKVAVQVSGLTAGVSKVSVGIDHTCALTTGGSVKCWGDNSKGQIGSSGGTGSKIPVSVSELSSISGMVVGWYHGCAITSNGGLKCWGYNNAGQLGNGSTTNTSVPTDVTGLPSGVAQITANEANMCATTTAGALKCWGTNTRGQLGTSSVTGSNVPLDVAGLSPGVATVASGRQHTCAVLLSGPVKCWGYNGYGQLGNGSAGGATPQTITFP